MTNKEQVDEHIATLEPSHRPIIEYIRQAILTTHTEIGEQIKWNSPSFYYTGPLAPFEPKTYKRDLLVCNLHRGKILLVFPTGEKIADHIGGKNYPDGRKIITIVDLADFKRKESAIQQIIREWLKLLE